MTKCILGTTRLAVGASIIALAMAACSDDELDNNAPEQPSKPGTEKMVVNNDPSSFAGRVTNYKDDASPRSRAGEVPYDMPEMPAVPGDAIDATAAGFEPWNTQAGVAYVIPAGKTLEGNINLNGCTFYVQGTWKYSNGCWNTAKIIVMNGGKLEWPAGQALVAGMEINNYGTFAISGNDFTTNLGSRFLTAVDFTLPGQLRPGDAFHIGGNLNAGSLDDNNSGSLYVGGDATFSGKAAVTNGGTLYVHGRVNAPDFLTDSRATATVECAATFTNTFYVTNGATFNALAYVKSPVTKFDSDARFYLNAGGLAVLGDLSIPNAPTVRVSSANGEAGQYAVITADRITVNNNDLRNTFGGYLGLHYGELIDDNSGNPVEFQAQILINGDDHTSIQAGDCIPESFGDNTPQPEPVVIIDHIAEITCPEHTHDISATCVQMNGSKAYISYHQRGPEYSGCIEVAEVTGNTVELVSFMRSETERDFNHLIVDNNRIYAAGGSRKGGHIVYVDLADGIFSSGNADGLNLIRLKGGDGNCIVRNQDRYLVTSTYGLETFDANTLEAITDKETPGSAKHIDMDGNGNMVTLNLGDRNTTESPAEVTLWSAADLTFSNPLQAFTAGIITPVNGKNVCLVDGANVYTCLGQNGFVRFTGGAQSGSYNLSAQSNAAANGVDYDDKYIYVAYGSMGLHVLDKNTLEPVATYKYSGGKSANYVRVANGYIYVSYGRSGLQVFRLTTKK